MSPEQHFCDIAIVGGGPVGIALALALRDSGLKITVLEARPAQNSTTDPRALAISYGSRLLLARLGLWDVLNNVTPIRTIHISQKHSFGRTVLRADELGVPELGYVLPYHTLHRQMQTALQASHVDMRGNVHYLAGAAVTQLQGTAAGATLRYQHAGKESVLDTKLAVVADGGKLLEATHPPHIHDYGQSALIAHLTCSQPQLTTAFERFTAQGPVALLPFSDGYELVWTVAQENMQTMLDWDNATFLTQLQQHFGDRVGDFLSVGARTHFPLRLKRAPQCTIPHTVLLGNAAQTLHPVAGQGFNLGLRDVWELAQAILRSVDESASTVNLDTTNLGSPAMLADFQKSRKLDRDAGIRFTDSLVRLFSNDLFLLSGGRAAAFSVLDNLPNVKKFVAKRMMFGSNG